MKNLKKPGAGLLLATMIFSTASTGFANNLTQNIVNYNTSTSNDTISIVDENLKLAITKELGKNKEDVLTKKDLESIKNLTLDSKNISNLKGIEYCTNLENLSLGNNNISDISNLENLTKLKHLSLNNNNISDISSLKNLVNLEILSLTDNNISDLKPISKLKKLHTLHLGKNNIKDLSYIAYLEELTDLNLRNNNISDITSLSNIPKTKNNAYIDLTMNDLNLNDSKTMQAISLLSEKGYNVIYEEQNHNMPLRTKTIKSTTTPTTGGNTTGDTTTDDGIVDNKPGGTTTDDTTDGNNPVIPNPPIKFTDIQGNWAEKIIKQFVEDGYINGYPDGTFKPNNSITRAEFIKVFNKYFGLSKKTGKVLSDTSNHWAKDEIDIAISNGIIQGFEDGTFRPNDPLTREQAAKIISNYTKLTDTNYNKLDSYKDHTSISAWAKSAVEAMLDNGYMNGYEDDTIRAKNNMTRAEAVTLLSRINKNIK